CPYRTTLDERRAIRVREGAIRRMRARRECRGGTAAVDGAAGGRGWCARRRNRRRNRLRNRLRDRGGIGAASDDSAGGRSAEGGRRRARAGGYGSERRVRDGRRRGATMSDEQRGRL